MQQIKSEGPWSAEPRDYDATWAIVDQNGDHIASVPNPYEHLGDRDDLVAAYADQTRARARLIAAAPDLLEALAKIAVGEGYYGAQAAEYKAKATLAKHGLIHISTERDA